MSNTTHPTEEQIREAANTSPEAKKALKKLYPTILFKAELKQYSGDIKITENPLKTVFKEITEDFNTNLSFCFGQVRKGDYDGGYYRKGVLLSTKETTKFEIITEEDTGIQVLVPVV